MIVRPEIPYVPSMYKHTASATGDWPAVVFWYATDRQTQDKYVELWKTYLYRSTSSVKQEEVDAFEKLIAKQEADYEKGRADLTEVAAAEGTDPAAGLERYQRAHDNLLLVRRKEIERRKADMEHPPFKDDSEKDSMRRELISLVLRRIVVNGTTVVWPSVPSAQQEVLTSAGIAPHAWEEAIGAFAQGAYWDGALPKS